MTLCSVRFIKYHKGFSRPSLALDIKEVLSKYHDLKDYRANGTVRHIVIEPDGSARGAYHSELTQEIIDDIVLTYCKHHQRLWRIARLEVNTTRYIDGYGELIVHLVRAPR